ncbi:hypothetical protein [Sphingobium tyrosinilyticum]
MAYDGVSMEKIASETGLARTTLYSRFRRNPTCSVQSTGDVKDIGEVLCLRVADMASLLVDPLFRGLHALILLNRRRFPDLAPLMHELGYLNAVRLLAQDIRAAAQRTALRNRKPWLNIF